MTTVARIQIASFNAKRVSIASVIKAATVVGREIARGRVQPGHRAGRWQFEQSRAAAVRPVCCLAQSTEFRWRRANCTVLSSTSTKSGLPQHDCHDARFGTRSTLAL
jgi:hypothetical protein